MFKKEYQEYNDYDDKDVHHKKLCTICDKPLRRFKKKQSGDNRMDWKGRTTHLKCWKEEH